jgi:hypothetical protein
MKTYAEEQVINLLKLERLLKMLLNFEDPKPAYNTVSTIIRILEKRICFI